MERTTSQRRRSRVRTVRALLTAGLAMLIVPACGDGGESSGAERVTLRVATLTAAASPRRQLALESGAFDDAAYDIEWVDFPSTKDALESIAAGAVDVGLHMQPPAALVAAGNADPAWTPTSRPFAIIGATTVASPAGSQVLVRSDSSITKLSDLEGKKIGVSKGSLSHYFLLVAAAADGLTEFEPVYLPPADLAAALDSGAVDAVAGGISLVALVSAGSARSIRASLGMFDEFEVHIVRNTMLADPTYDAVLRDLLVRNERFNEWARDHQDEVAAVHTSELGFSADAAEAAARRFWGERMTAASCTSMLADMSTQFFASGVTASEPDIATFIDGRFDDTP